MGGADRWAQVQGHYVRRSPGGCRPFKAVDISASHYPENRRKTVLIPTDTDRFEGDIQYAETSASLHEDDGTISLLVVDVPPPGVINPQDVVAAVALFRDLLKVPDGKRITVSGRRTSVFGQTAILMLPM